MQLPSGTPVRAAPDPGTAVESARQQIEQARRTGDPRYLGYAEGLLRPWWDRPEPPGEVLLLRATLLQSRHEFDAALRDLDRLLAREPDHAQALLTKAAVLRVRGRPAQAAAACRRLRGADQAFVAAVCLGAVRGLTGEREAAIAVLDRLARDSSAQHAAVRTWLAAERGDLADRAGNPRRALAIYATALATGLEDLPLRASAIDLLLQAGRVQEALRLADAGPPTDALQLRAAVAARALDRPRPRAEAALADAFAAARRRGSGEHLREEGRFALEIQNDAGRALALAQRNWETQREPADARLLAAAARAAGTPAAADPVRAHVAATRLQDAALERLLGP